MLGRLQIGIAELEGIRSPVPGEIKAEVLLGVIPQLDLEALAKNAVGGIALARNRRAVFRAGGNLVLLPACRGPGAGSKGLGAAGHPGVCCIAIGFVGQAVCPVEIGTACRTLHDFPGALVVPSLPVEPGQASVHLRKLLVVAELVIHLAGEFVMLGLDFLFQGAQHIAFSPSRIPELAELAADAHQGLHVLGRNLEHMLVHLHHRF